MNCNNSDCKKEIKDGEKYIGSKYGDFCSNACWTEIAEGVVGYFNETRNVEEENRQAEAAERRRQEARNRPKWGDDL